MRVRRNLNVLLILRENIERESRGHDIRQPQADHSRAVALAPETLRLVKGNQAIVVRVDAYRVLVWIPCAPALQVGLIVTGVRIDLGSRVSRHQPQGKGHARSIGLILGISGNG